MFILAPLLGLTNTAFRNTFVRHFSGLDAAVAPFISVVNNQRLSHSLFTDILPENNTSLKLTPQLIGNHAEAFLNMTKKIQQLGYTEINLNLGCPMPLVAKKKRGSGFLPYPELIAAFLEDIFEQIEIDISIKTRLGYQSSDEIDALIPVFNAFPLKSLCIHPRTGKQQYEGVVDIAKFASIYTAFHSEIIYNGDISTVDDIQNLQNQFPDIKKWMIGRALLKNPFLLEENSQGAIDECQKNRRFEDFVWDFYTIQSKRIQAEKSLLNVMKEYWQYFSAYFSDATAVFNHLKRCKTKADFENKMAEIFRAINTYTSQSPNF